MTAYVSSVTLILTLTLSDIKLSLELQPVKVDWDTHAKPIQCDSMPTKRRYLNRTQCFLIY